MRKYQTYWISADLHLGHDILQEYSGRPQDFERQVLQHHHNMMNETDIFIFLGDFCISNDLHWHDTFLNAPAIDGVKKWLIRGNHDRKTNGWYYDHGWDVVADELVISLYGYRLLFTHKPVNLLRDPPIDFNIHGHLHNTEHHEEVESNLRTEKHKLIMMEHGYAPQFLKQIVGK